MRYINLDLLGDTAIKNKYHKLMAEYGYFKIIVTITRYESNTYLDYIFIKSKIIKCPRPLVI